MRTSACGKPLGVVVDRSGTAQSGPAASAAVRRRAATSPPVFEISRGRERPLTSELQACLTRGFRQRLDAAMVTKAGTIECNLLDARLQRGFGDGLADRCCSCLIL